MKITDLKAMNQVRDGLFAIDDAYILLNSRDMKGNVQALEIMARSRKRKLEIILTTVRAWQIDKNVRENVALLWRPACVPSPIKGNPPIALTADCYEFIPSEKEVDSTGDYKATLRIWGTTLRKIMCIYDTYEEVENFE